MLKSSLAKKRTAMAELTFARFGEVARTFSDTTGQQGTARQTVRRCDGVETRRGKRDALFWRELRRSMFGHKGENPTKLERQCLLQFGYHAFFIR